MGSAAPSLEDVGLPRRHEPALEPRKVLHRLQHRLNHLPPPQKTHTPLIALVGRVERPPPSRDDGGCGAAPRRRDAALAHSRLAPSHSRPVVNSAKPRQRCSRPSARHRLGAARARRLAP